MNAIELRGLTKSYGSGRGVFDLSLSIPEGEVFGYLGPNGSGKTTTIRQLMGFIRPQKGSCSILGLDCSREAAAIQASVGYIPGEISLIDDMTGMDFLKFYASYRGVRDLSRARLLMERFELDPKGRLRRMSKGMKQKVGILCAFLHDPQVLILDEPTSGLDPLMQSRFIELILEEKERGKTILMSSHIFEEVERTCSRVGIIKEGHLVAVDSIDALKAARRKTYLVTLPTPQEARAFAEGCGLPVLSLSRSTVAVAVQNSMAAFTAALASAPVVNLDIPHQGLEEIFMQYYGGEAQ